MKECKIPVCHEVSSLNFVNISTHPDDLDEVSVGIGDEELVLAPLVHAALGKHMRRLGAAEENSA